MTLTPTEQLLIDLLNIPSESGHEETIIDTLERILREDFRIQRIPVDDRRSALLCTHGERLDSLLIAHVDTVTGQQEVNVDKKNIYGRGSCDNKGAAAAMICAARTALKENVSNFGLLFTIGEETTFDGARAAEQFLNLHALQPKQIIIGEPTDLEIINAQHGIFCIEVSCKGTREHSSISHPDSAIHKLVHVLHHVLSAPFANTTFHIGKIQGGVAENIVANSASAVLVFRSAQPTIENLVRTVLNQTRIEYAIKVLKNIPPCDHSTSPADRRRVAYFTEMAFFPNSFVLGPGSIADAHSLDEKVAREQLREATEIYVQLLKSGLTVAT
ncbi:MAG TPA: M20/M25/M40 family metallo-hydrolase [Patescibacteria group bacterium]|nr:M20/M25/M40 family metallo-hydrolase [Patescibacteria group bacterium]